MGVSAATAEFLGEARRDGVSFESTLTIGRQTVFAPPSALARIAERTGAMPAGRTKRSLMESFDRAPWVLDPYLEALGAREVRAMDISEYEGADVMHDLNEPVPPELRERFDVVFDGGTIEHVFDVPAALRNYMSMVRVGGRLIVLTMANNHMGHGFYQLSPELFHRVMSPENGYVVERMQLGLEDVEYGSLAGVSFPFEMAGGRRYDVADPDVVGERVLLRSRQGITLIVQARRVAAVEPLARPPQQSDYTPLWEAGRVDLAVTGPQGPLRSLFRRAANPARMMEVNLGLLPKLHRLVDPLARRRVARSRSLRNRRFYRRLGSGSRGDPR